MIRVFALAFAVAFGLGAALSWEDGSGSDDAAVGVALAPDEMSFVVGQTGCPLNPNLVRNPAGACFVAATATGCVQSFNSITGWKNCCTAASTGGSFGCASVPSLMSSTGRAAVIPAPISCGFQNDQTCNCGSLAGTCYQTISTGNPCGTKTASLPSC